MRDGNGVEELIDSVLASRKAKVAGIVVHLCEQFLGGFQISKTETAWLFALTWGEIVVDIDAPDREPGELGRVGLVDCLG
ncbi:MAG TPA: hypothetical protein VNL14_16780 [Candidatus Acidoferrales bacterium]|nr:hypothetical protein [Candidatus Acidoferrales bacterium]